MFFRRMFSRKDNNNSNNVNGGNGSSSGQSAPSSTTKFIQNALPLKSPKRSQRRLSLDGDNNKRNLSVLQLTPLWEHIIRTRKLPDDINPIQMFDEFLERLKDPEWQVRQHALKVLVDVLTVIGPKADAYFGPLIPQLVENLGHPAPTVRKGALDCLRVYIVETQMPETILLEILDIGLNQRITNEPFGGRLTCGVMLSLPSLVQATLHTPKRNYILRSTIEMLVNKMTQITHQEITLKVLLKLKELLGPREFSEYMTHAAYREFDLLCNVYGIGEKNVTNANRSSSWKVAVANPYENTTDFNPLEFWRPLDEDLSVCDMQNDDSDDNTVEKVIMETEIKINDDTLTMRILETSKSDRHKRDDDDDEKTVENSSDDDDDDGDDNDDAESDDVVLENSGLIQVLTDSELEEINKNVGDVDDEYVRRTPKRVTFGGEIVKMRTPDSDTVTQNSDGGGDDQTISSSSTTSNKIMASNSQNKLSFLTVEIPNDNTKPLPSYHNHQIRPKSAISPRNTSKTSPAPPISISLQNSPKKSKFTSDELRPKSGSPRSPFRRINISPVDSIISPRPDHKEVEVLHNLQRSPCPSPRRQRRMSVQHNEIDESPNQTSEKRSEGDENRSKVAQPSVKSWEELGLVDENTIKNLKSGDWRLRSHAIYEIEESLKSSENLALVQPYLDSLLRTLLLSEKNLDVAEDKRRVIMNLISRLPLDNLENRIGQIITGLCRQGGAGSNRVSKALMQRLPPAVIVLKLLSDDFLHARSSRFRENALQMVMYALMTFPSTLFDTTTCVTRATYAALDRKKRVRQASLDVLAVLGQVTSPRTVIDIVQNISNTREDGNNLLNAVKARLARKQLPIISSDGLVQYTLRIPSPQINYEQEQLANLGADIEWIASGIGSVSPTSLKRRTPYFHQTIQNNTNNNTLNGKIYGDPNRDNNDDIRRHNNGNFGLDVGFKQNERFIGNTTNMDGSNLQYSPITSGIPMKISTHKMTNGAGGGSDIIGIYGKRVGTKSCSDSSQDGRSSDSTNNGNSIRGPIRLPTTSRFPAMERLNVTDIYGDRQSFRNPYDNQAYITQQGFNSTFPKANYSVYQRKIPKTINQDTFTESSYESSSYSNGNSTNEINVSSQNPKRFMNVEKFMMQSSKHHPQSSYHHEDGVRQSQEYIRKVRDIENNESPSTKITTNNHYELSSFRKSNENLRCSSGIKNDQNQTLHLSEVSSSDDKTSSCHSTPTRVMGQEITPVTSSHGSDEIQIIDKSPSLTSNKISEKSLQSENQDETKNSRPQSKLSTKSLTVEDTMKIEHSESQKKIIIDLTKETMNELKNSTVNDTNVIAILPETDENETKSNDKITDNKTTDENEKEDKTIIDEPDNKNQHQFENQTVSENKSDSITTLKPENENESPARSPVPTVEVKPMSRENTTISKSCESIYENPSNTRQDIIDTKSNSSTETSSDYHPTILDDQSHTSSGFIEVKPQHTPLIRKSKTRFFNRNNRKVSPVKQSIKMNKTETLPPNLTRFDKPKEAIHITLNQLDSSNWETIMIGLNSIVRLMRHHIDILDTQIHMICAQLTKSVRNLRSQVSRAACQAATELFVIRSKYLENECDDLVGSLLHRTADTNRFLRADATRALESMCDNLTPQKVLHLLTTRGSLHQNALVRTTTAKLLNRLADRLGCERIFSMNREHRDKFIITGANLLLEGSLETRSYAKSLFRLLSEHHNYNKIFLDVIPTKTYRNIEKTLKSIR